MNHNMDNFVYVSEEEESEIEEIRSSWNDLTDREKTVMKLALMDLLKNFKPLK